MQSESVGAPAINNIWGLLRRGGNQENINLFHRTKDNRKDTFTIGRSRSCDITVEDKRVSSSHCLVYCDYTQVRLRVFIEDSSANGTFINDSLTRLTKGERMELKSGDEIYLINPRNIHSSGDKMAEFTFINMRERLVGQRQIGMAPVQSSSAPTKELQAHNNVVQSDGWKTNAPGIPVMLPGVSAAHIEDHYIIGDQIGSGMSGQVFFCVHRATNVQCAVKIIDTRKFVLTPGLSVTDLMEEAAIIQRLDHPNIIKVLDTFQTEHGVHIVMELLRGGDLFDRIVEKGRYTESSARKVMWRILSAVSYLHQHNIIHRDLKPENILMVSAKDDSEIKLTDFGLAKKADQEGLKTFCGTPQYFAPEVLKRKGTVAGAGRYGPAADMWSLGVVLYILLSGTFPFDEDNLFDQIQKASYNLNGHEWSNISIGAKHLVSSLLTLRADRRITVTQALKHPWIQNINYNPSAMTEPLVVKSAGGSDPVPNPYSSRSGGMPTGSTSTSTASKRSKTAKVTGEAEGDQSSQSQSSRPHIGTVPLFMARKQSIVAKEPSSGEAIAEQQLQRSPVAETEGARVLSEAVDVVVNEVTAAVPNESKVTVTKSLVPDSKNDKQVDKKRGGGATQKPKAVPLVAKDLSEDEIENCSSGSDCDGAVKMKVANDLTGLNKKSKTKAKTSSKATHQPEPPVASIIPNVGEEITGSPAGVPKPVSATLKRQRSLEDAWSKVSKKEETKSVQPLPSPGLVPGQDVECNDLVNVGDLSTTLTALPTEWKSNKKLRVKVLSIAELFRLNSNSR